ncbi:MAG: carbohydrate kinase [Pseudodesulfovibrio sp.]|nr:carbohydrate kinase [Pseudodesulfovibrio sp.]
MHSFLAIGLGELLWDVLPEGRKLGGAPANFAYHVNALGSVGVPVSRVGDDDLGREALAELSGRGVSTQAISVDADHPTGTVDARVDEQGVASYIFPDNVAWDFLSFGTKTLDLAVRADAICFGSLAQRSRISRDAIQAFLHGGSDALKVYDMNIRKNFYSLEIIRMSLSLADVLKINEDELALVAEMFSLPSGEREALAALMAAHGLKLAVLTRGAHGSLIVSADQMSDLPGQPTAVVDTIGAGDSFTAAVAVAYLHGKSLDEINRYATEVAAYVCGQPGAMPKMPQMLKLRD